MTSKTSRNYSLCTLITDAHLKAIEIHVLFSLFFSVLAVFAVYVLGGVVYNRTRHYKTGAELFPNLPFWTAVSALVKVAAKWLIHQRCSILMVVCSVLLCSLR